MNERDEAFLAQIEQYGRLVFSSVGDSMYPMLRSKRDVVVLKRAEGELRRLDVALYRSEDGRYVLHRVLGADKDGYRFCGDDMLICDPPVPRENVLAVLTSFYREGREISADDAGYRLYARVWCAGMGIRRALLLVLRVQRGIKRRLRGGKRRG